MTNRRRSFPLEHIAVPFNRGTGGFTPLTPTFPYYPAMMQVIEEDTHENYVVCRGFDAEHNVFINSLPVAKPYGERGTTGTYNVGEVYPAIKPRTAIGFTPGKAETSTGHPADLNEKIVGLQTEEGVWVQWLLLTGEGSSTLIGKLDADLDYDETTGVSVSIYSDPTTDSGTNKEGVLPPPWMTSGTINSGSWVEVFAWGGEWYADRVVASGTMKVTTLSADLSAGSSAATAAGITVYDELMATGESIGSGTKVYAMLADDGKWYVIAAPCEDA